MTNRANHAVVLGAGVGGLTHAIPLAARFDRVTIVDRDVLPDRPEPRRGVPQDSHLHLLIPRGHALLETLLPGVLTDLRARGGEMIDRSDWRVYIGGGRLELTGIDEEITGATRPLLESVVRDRVLALDGVELMDGWAARTLTATEDHSRVTGVRLRSEADAGDERTLVADLVVDTTGRASPSPRWLADLGYPVPEEQRLKVDVHYATRLFRREPGDLDGYRYVFVEVPPGGRRGGVALAVEGERWLVTLIGMAGERPPTDLDGFVDYAASLWTGDIRDIVAGATPLGDGIPRAFPAFLRRRYDRLRRLPERYVVSGDAVCSFNPRFGQGMTVAMAEAIELGSVLDRHGLDRTGPRLLSAAQSVVEDAWTLATGSDLTHPDVEGPRPLSWRLTTAYLERLLSVARHDPVVAAAFLRVIGMLARPQTLMRPRIVRRVLGRIGRAGRAVDREKGATSRT
ncbi:MAG TPA: hypothetical protein VFZ37_06465 [Jiangellaceae bacterium]